MYKNLTVLEIASDALKATLERGPCAQHADPLTTEEILAKAEEIGGPEYADSVAELMDILDIDNDVLREFHERATINLTPLGEDVFLAGVTWRPKPSEQL
jgi:DNA-binding PucR family transcriptional regulator